MGSFQSIFGFEFLVRDGRTDRSSFTNGGTRNGGMSRTSEILKHVKGTAVMETMVAMAALFLAARVVKERTRAAVVTVEKVETGTMVAVAEVVCQIMVVEIV
jgi:hypothetical protein